MSGVTSVLGSGAGGSGQQVVVNGVLFLAVFAYVLRRQLTVRAVTPRSFLLVVILFGYGLTGGFPTAAPGVALFGVSIVVSVVFGVWRATSMRMWRGTQGVVYRRGTAVTITLWVITVTIKVVLDMIEVAQTRTFTVGPIWLAMAATLAVQQYVMLTRAKSLTTA